MASWKRALKRYLSEPSRAVPGGAVVLHARWRALFQRALLRDGVLDDGEVELLREELLADGVLDDDEADFLIELWSGQASPTPAFDAFFGEAMAVYASAPGGDGPARTGRIRRAIACASARPGAAWPAFRQAVLGLGAAR